MEKSARTRTFTVVWALCSTVVCNTSMIDCFRKYTVSVDFSGTLQLNVVASMSYEKATKWCTDRTILRWRFLQAAAKRRWRPPGNRAQLEKHRRETAETEAQAAAILERQQTAQGEAEAASQERKSLKNAVGMVR